MLAHSFDRFYVGTKFILPSIGDLDFSISILPQIPEKQKCGIITTKVSRLIGLANEGISRFLHSRRNKALHKAVKTMDSKTTIQCNKLIQLENSMLMYGIYNTMTLEQLINTVHCIHNTTSSNEDCLQDNKAH